MSALNLGIIGCGFISTRYLRNAPLFKGVAVRAIGDLKAEVATAQGRTFGVEAVPVDKLLARADIDVVVNLTVPNAHYQVSVAALGAGKHVFSEKPLAVDLAHGKSLNREAERVKRLLGVAPDTILGPGHRLARKLVDEGRIGRVVAGTAFVMSRGMEHWHPDPTFFFKPGGGPVLDVGPYYITALVNLIGPVRRVVAMTGSGLAERLVTAEGPMKGQSIRVETPTTAFAVLEFAQGALVTLNLSWDVFKHGHRPIELHGTEGSLRAPDPNFFGGQVEYTIGRGDWQILDTRSEPLGLPNYPDDNPLYANYRMLGVAELAAAAAAGRQNRASGRLGLHVLDVMQAILAAGATGKPVTIEGGERPEAMSDEEIRALLVDPASVAAA
ncbi:MAG: Gfo/Idh/MocA family oxidoreductase [Proteobacteria bacterium]|nr:Gfo/Idh/MocA family oxidoreductase [Pseudomonadota bacterium]